MTDGTTDDPALVQHVGRIHERHQRAGHHGLILGTYLARAGLDILLVDRRLTYGGGLCTREVTLPGFYHNLHSINHFHISETPWFKDLNLDERVAYITPRYEFGQAHHD